MKRMLIEKVKAFTNYIEKRNALTFSDKSLSIHF